MSQGPTRGIALSSLLHVACGGEPPLDPCQAQLKAWSISDKSEVVTLPEEGGVGPLVAQVVLPWEAARYAEGAPAVVYVHGSWSADYVPMSASTAQLTAGQGLAGIYFNLPGGRGEYASGGTNDQRGPLARGALARVLRYARGDVEDDEGCTLNDRVPAGITGEIALAGWSNGGNLAWATLADGELDLPDIAGIATFETPANGQLATAEPGTDSRPSPLYEEGACQLDHESALSCDFAYDPLGFDRSLDPERAGLLWVDDGDRVYDEELDFPLGVVWNPDTQLWTHSTQAITAAQAAGLGVETRSNPTETAAFWAEREAPRAMPAAAEAWPRLLAIATGTEVDHVLQGATDHPHVTGMVAAQQAAGVFWSRLHADAAYVRAVAGMEGDYADVPADTLVGVGDPDLPMQPEDTLDVRGGDYLTAAVIEILDRARNDSFEADLEEVIF